MKEKIYFKTFGCRTNIYDSELLKNYILDYEIVNDENLADIIIINSCTVTNKADSGTRAYINNMQKKGIKLILTGCGAISKGKELLKENKIFGVFGGANKNKINSFLKQNTKFYELGDLKFIDKDIVTRFSNHTKAFIKIQEGCDYNCSYCIIPQVRGKSRSIKEEDILKQAHILAQNGYMELVLTGTNIGSYGLKNNSSLGVLLQKLGQIKGIKRIRLGSLEPAQIDNSFKEILDEDFLEKHLHIALQHTNEKMLRIMRRRSHSDDDLKLFELLSNKGFALGTDFIVAHPGETTQIWEEAIENFKKFNITHIHAFVFSPRKNTYSSTINIHPINGEIAKQRLHLLKNIVNKNNENFRKKIFLAKIMLEILVENKKHDYFEGYDQFYNKIKIYSKKDISKEWLILNKYDFTTKENIAKI